MYRKNLGEQIKDIVEDAVVSCNYHDLNDKIRNTAQRAIDEFNHATGSYMSHDDDRRWDDAPHEFGEDPDYKRRGFRGTQNQGDSFTRRNRRQEYGRGSYSETSYGDQTYRSYQRPNRDTSVRIRKPKVRIKGRVSSIVATVLGSIGASAFGITAVVLTCIWAALGFQDSVFQVLVSSFSMATLACSAVIVLGVNKRKFIGRYEIYKSLLNKNRFCELKRMAEVVNKPKSFVQNDLQKMLMLSMFPEGHFDEQKTCFMQDDETYQQYMAAQSSYQERMKEDVDKTKAKKVSSNEKTEKVENEELKKAIATGKEYIRQIREANDDIPGEEISRKLDKLETIISKIFVCIEKHPEKLSEIRKFMEYYLPITSKLVNAYKEFDVQPIQGENIINSKKEIEATLDTIDLAFEKLLDSLYENEAMEVSSDISVLNALFAQEGLTKKDFDMSK